MLSIDIFRPSAHLDYFLPVPAENETNTGTRTRSPPLLPPYSAQPREGERIVCCDRLPTRQVVRLHRRRCLAWLPGLGRLQRCETQDQDDLERAELAVVYGPSLEPDESPGKLVVSG
jgi:hypothetical protein